MCDLITSTKNEKIFQESIGLAIRLLDGGNTEIQVWSWGRSRVVPATRRRGVPGAWLQGWVQLASTSLATRGWSHLP